MPVPVVGRNEIPSPRGVAGWSGAGTAGTPAAEFTPNVAAGSPPLAVSTAARIKQSGLSGNVRVVASPRVFDTDVGGTVWGGTLQGYVDLAAQRCLNPICAANANGWAGFGQTGWTAARVTGLTGMVASTGYRTTNGNAAGAMAIYGDTITVTAGEALQGTLQVRPSVAMSYLAWFLVWYDSAGAQLGSAAGPSGVSAAAGAAVTRAVSGTVPSGAVTARVAVIANGSAPAGATLTATGHRIAPGSGDTDMEYGGSNSCSAELVFRDSAGVALSTITGAATTVNTQTAVRLGVSGTAPAGTRRIDLVFLGRAVPALSTAYGTAARLAQDADASLPFADALFPGWAHEGTAEQSPSSARALTLLDVFSGLADGPLAGRSPTTGPAGQAWSSQKAVNGSGEPLVIRNGAIGPPAGHTPGMGAPPAAGYAMLDLGRTVDWAGVDVRWDSSTSKASSFALGGFSTQDLATLIATGGSNLHLAVSLETVELAVFSKGTNGDANGDGKYTRLAPTGWTEATTVIPLATPMAADGTSVYQVDVWKDPNDPTVAWVKVAGNTTLRYQHPYIRDVSAPNAFYEYFTQTNGTNIPRFVRAWARPVPGLQVGASDAGAGADTARTAAALTPLTDSATGAESTAVGVGLARSDTAAGSHTATAVVTAAAPDTATGTDSAALARTSSRTDTAVGFDTALVSSGQAATDSGAAADTATVARVSSLDDTADGSDTASSSAAVVALEQGTGADTVDRGIVNTSRDALDAGTGADTTTVAVVLARGDAGTGADGASVRTADALAAADTGAGTDSASTAVAAGSAEQGAGVDTARASAAGAATDTGVGAETARIARSATVDDTAVGADLARTTAAVTAADTAQGAATATSSAGITLGDDLAAGADTGRVVAAVTAADGGHSSDSASTLAQATSSDTAAAAHDVDLTVALTRGDTAVGADAARVVADPTVGDAGTGADTARTEAVGAATDTASGTDDVDLGVRPAAQVDTAAGVDDVAEVLRWTDVLDTAEGVELVAGTAVVAALDTAAATDTARVQVNAVAHPLRARSPRPDQRPRATPRPMSS